jgi:hypothetical protein
VVAAVGPEEALVRARELLGAVRGERLALLVARAGAPLGREQVRRLGIVRQPWAKSRTPARNRSAVSPNASSSRPISTARRAPTGSNGAEVRRAVMSGPTRRGSR